jgi:O-antigen/teichoic acid export membrane protein
VTGLRLPVTWPLVALFVLFPIWWLAGIGSFIWPVISVLALLALIWNKWTRAPVPIMLWLAFCVWVLLSMAELHKGSQILTALYRLLLYLGAAVLFLYAYNLPRSRRMDVKAVRILVIFWMIVVVGGYAGLALRSATFTPPIEHLLPLSIRTKPFVQELVRPVFAQVQNFLGFPVPRPAAPFAFTNLWGGMIAVLTPVAFASVLIEGPGLRRRVVLGFLAASVVPMAFSLDRGMFLSLAVGISYVAIRLALRGRVHVLPSMLALGVISAVVVFLTPLGHLVTSSFNSTHGSSNATRQSLSALAIAGANQSPLLGHGAPQAPPAAPFHPIGVSTQRAAGVSQTPPAIGTQGQLWTVLFTNGYPATLCFFGFFAWVFWQTRRARGTAGLWLHAVTLIAVVQTPVYGWLPAEVQVVMVIAALAYRRCWQRPVAAIPARVAAEPLASPEPISQPALSGAGVGTGAFTVGTSVSQRTVPARRRAVAPVWDESRASGLPGDGVGAPVAGPGARTAELTATRPMPAFDPGELSAEAGQVARGSAINFAAMVGGALLGFALTVLVSRWLQPRLSGVLFELIALFTILSNVFVLGADTGLTRWISRARAVGDLFRARRVITVALLPVLIVGAVGSVATWIAAPQLASIFLHGMTPGTAANGIRLMAVMVPLGAMSVCMLAAARGYGRMWPNLAIEGVGKPVARLGLVLVALAAGWGLRGAIIAWSLPVAVGLVGGMLILNRLIHAEMPTVSRSREQRSTDVSRPGLADEFWRFAAPRGLAGMFQFVVLWLDILLVGWLTSSYSAGVYAAVSKLALLGAFALEGTRLAIGPHFSALFARHQLADAEELYQGATSWLVLVSWPLYLIFAIFPVVALGIFGQKYTAGAAALVVLSLAMLVNLGTGNVTVVLLMAGKSSWNVLNAAAALAVNVGLNVVLIPRIGIVGAAIAWAASILVDNVAALAEVHWVLGMEPFGRGYPVAAAAALGSFGVPGVIARAVLGQSLAGLAATVAVGVPCFALVSYLARSRLQLTGLVAALRPQRRQQAVLGRSSRRAA